MTTELRPVGEKILVRRIEPEEKEGTIILPEAAKEKSREGEIVAVGSGRLVKGERIPPEVCVGDRIIFSSINGMVDVNGETLLVMAENNIIAVVCKA